MILLNTGGALFQQAADIGPTEDGYIDLPEKKQKQREADDQREHSRREFVGPGADLKSGDYVSHVRSPSWVFRYSDIQVFRYSGFDQRRKTNDQRRWQKPTI